LGEEERQVAQTSLSDRDWQIRLAVYRRFVDDGRPPAYSEVARELGLPPEEAQRSYRRLHEHHALFLEQGTDTIRMANPLSAVPTPYRVLVNGRWLWANCAWDSLGIPAMLHRDAQVEVVFAHTGEAIGYAIESGELKAADSLVHFALPFRRWYDDLIHT
jgi:hypothetical protein